MSRRTTSRVGLALALGACAAVASLAVAQEPSTSSSPEQAALDRFCANQHPCVVVNGAADPSDSGSVPHLSTLGEALAASGKPPSACPQARNGYAAASLDVDAFVGPCPQAPPRASEVAPRLRSNMAEAMAVQGGSQ